MCPGSHNDEVAVEDEGADDPQVDHRHDHPKADLQTAQYWGPWLGPQDFGGCSDGGGRGGRVADIGWKRPKDEYNGGQFECGDKDVKEKVAQCHAQQQTAVDGGSAEEDQQQSVAVQWQAEEGEEHLEDLAAEYQQIGCGGGHRLKCCSTQLCCCRFL